MASDLLSKWLIHYDPIHRGYTPAGLANGVSATNGWTFPRLRGGYNLYRGRGGETFIDYAHPVGAAGVSATNIRNFAWRPHGAGALYAYVVKSIGGGGVESAGSHPPRVVAFDGQGDLVGLRPNPPTAVAVRAAAFARFVVRWTYVPGGQEAGPSGFRVYHDHGTGTVDYGTVEATVPYRAGRLHYEYESSPVEGGGRRIWAVRPVTGEGVEDDNMVQVMAWTNDASPPAHPLVTLSRVAEGEG